MEEDWEQHADRLAARSLATGDATGWFEQLYAAGRAGSVAMPWSREHPHPVLASWTRERALGGTGLRAVVVGCGLGADAEHVAALGYDTVAFDVSGTAVDLARDRHPGSTVRYVVAAARGEADPEPDGPPWPLTRDEVEAFAAGDLGAVAINRIPDQDDPAFARWLAEFRRP